MIVFNIHLRVIDRVFLQEYYLFVFLVAGWPLFYFVCPSVCFKLANRSTGNLFRSFWVVFRDISFVKSLSLRIQALLLIGKLHFQWQGPSVCQNGMRFSAASLLMILAFLVQGFPEKMPVSQNQTNIPDQVSYEKKGKIMENINFDYFSVFYGKPCITWENWSRWMISWQGGRISVLYLQGVHKILPHQ